MRRHPALLPAAGRAIPAPAGLAILLVALLALALAGCGDASAPDFGPPAPDQRVFDRAGVLSATERADLEAHAAGVARAGAPTIVYLRLLDASYDQTVQDARDLMDAWRVESVDGARDGLVVFLNLKPDDPHHG